MKEYDGVDVSKMYLISSQTKPKRLTVRNSWGNRNLNSSLFNTRISMET
jgi:hypothetical protein